MQLCEVRLAPNELSERPRSALRDLIKEPEQRPHSDLRGLLDAIPNQPEVKPTATALIEIFDGND